jgi:DNA polymerase-3 subunit gamma/tau
MSEAIYRTYRPKTFANLVGQEHVKTTIGNQIAGDSVAHAYLFTGPRGVGKTTVARLIAKAVNCERRKGFEPCNACDACREVASGSSLDVFEIDAASHTDVENVRENIIKGVRFAPNRLKFKVYIIDEVHMLSTSSFNALLKTLEEPPSHALFILATTEIHKVPATIISRCQRFDFRKLKSGEMVGRLKEIVKEEGVKVDEEVLLEVARHADGCERDAESMLGQILALGDKKIGIEQASLVLPTTTHVMVEAFTTALMGGNVSEAIRLANQYAEEGVDLPHFTDDVVDYLREKMLADLSAGKQAEVSRGSAAIDKLLDARRHMKTDRLPQLSLELAIVQIATPPGNFPKLEVDLSRPGSVPSPVSHELASRPATPDSYAQTAFVPSAGTEPGLGRASFDDVKNRWNELFTRIKDVNASLPLVLRAGVLAGVEGNVVRIRCAFAFHAETLNQERNRMVLEETLSALHGLPLRIRAEHVPEVEEAVADIVKEFGGSVV